MSVFLSADRGFQSPAEETDASIQKQYIIALLVKNILQIKSIFKQIHVFLSSNRLPLPAAC